MLEGEVDVHTSVYAPVRLAVGDSIYIDSTMGHAYVAAGSQPCRVLAICSGTESQLIAAVGGQPGSDPPVSPAPALANAAKRPRRRRAD